MKVYKDNETLYYYDPLIKLWTVYKLEADQRDAKPGWYAIQDDNPEHYASKQELRDNRPDLMFTPAKKNPGN